VEFNWVTFALEIVNFLVLVWILKRFLYAPVLQTIARRKSGIEQTLADARTRHSEAEALELRYRDRLAEWEKEKQGLRAQAAAEIEAERARRMAALQDTLETERARRRAVDERQADEWRNRLDRQAAEQGAQFSARLLARLASRELEARLVALALEDLARFSGAQLQAIWAACSDGQERIVVTSAFHLPETERNALLHGLAQATAARLSADFVEDSRLLAGLRINIGPWVMHANLEDELAFFADASHRET
jgi:F-type H+-transporting ATPase subunit b